MIDVCRDTEGVRKALEEMLEEDFARSRIERAASGASEATRARMEAHLPQRTLSPGYYKWGEHLLRIEGERKVGVVFTGADLASVEIDGLIALDRAREQFKFQHPPCSACGAHQDNRFSRECSACGVKFRQKGER